MINMQISPSESDKEANSCPPFSLVATHWPLSKLMQCPHVNVATPSAPQTNVPSAIIPPAWAIDAYPWVPSFTRASQTDTSIVPVEVRISFSLSEFFTSSDKMSCQKGSFGFGADLFAVRPPPPPPPERAPPELPSRRRRLLRTPVQGPPPGAVTLTALALPSSSWPISNSTSQPSSFGSWESSCYVSLWTSDIMIS